ncbi:hypothetical protein C8F04DRAFT_1255765 [Mycena alexandri]|uniref:Uncharacterized protein n=1 Tax=Mycena alexandri TaxID=1745969 RepID=A0AAD6X821_9AGAR|nr:hypothetical protein C8F04DRAFT_1255765 [Mycena alexandri]
MSTSEQSRQTPISIPTSELARDVELSTTTSIPTSELARDVELSTTTTNTNTNNNNNTDVAYTDAEDDIRFAIEYFERIGQREKIHEWAVERHLKERTQASLQRVIYTFDKLHRTQSQTPPPLFFDITRLDVNAALARGRAKAFGEDTAEAEREWAYNLSQESLTAPCHTAAAEMGASAHRDILWNADEARAALDHIQSLVKRLIPEDAPGLD